MASLKVILDKQKDNPSGEYPVIIRVLHNRGRRIISLSQKVKIEDWNAKKSMVNEKLGSPEQKRYNKKLNYYIDSELMKLKKIILDLESTTNYYTVDDIIKAYHNKTSFISVFSYIKEIVDSLEKIGKNGNSNVYKGTMGILQKYSKGRDLTFEEINYSFLKNFEAHLQAKGSKINTISFYLRTIRSIFNRAIKDGLVREEHYPFKKIKIKKEKTLKRAIYKEEIAMIKNLDLSNRPLLDLAKDLFLFSFYMRGMSFKDIAFLKVNNIIADRIYYSRQKTAQKLNIKLTDKAMDIILKYNDLSDRSGFIFPIVKYPGKNEFNQYKNGYRKTNRRLKVIGDMLNFRFPLTTYVARHSWASIAKRSGIPTSVISEGLGHDSEKTTQIYLDSFENNVLDAANDIITDI